MKRLITHAVIPAVLFLSGTFAGLYYFREVSFGSLQYFHSNSQMTGSVGDELIRGERIRGEFTARENNLGTVAIPVYTFNRINNDIIVFQLREKGNEGWQVFNKYFTDRFPTNEVFPFGFPVIPDSKGKTYEFELYSVNGEPGMAIALGRGSNIFASQYVFTRHELQRDRSMIMEFAGKKILNLFSRPVFALYLFIFYIPLILYVNFYIFRRQLMKEFGLITIIGHGLIIAMTTIFIFQPVLFRSNLSIVLVALIRIQMMLFKMPVYMPFMYALVLVCLMPVWIFLQKENVANSAAVMSFFLLLFGLATYISEYVGLTRRVGRRFAAFTNRKTGGRR
jgi:hypothetical protein